MAATLGITDTIAALYGLYLIAAGIGLMRDPELADRIMGAMTENATIAFLTGLVALALGGAIVAVHNQWTGFVTVIVSLLGWAVLIEGILMLAIPGPFIGFFSRMKFTHGFVRAVSVLAVLCGAILLFVVLT